MDTSSVVVAGITFALAVLGLVEAIRQWRSSDKWKWELVSVMIFAAGNFIVGVLTVFIAVWDSQEDAEASRQIGNANTRATNAITRAENAEQRVTEVEKRTAPKPFGVRFKEAMDAIDPAIFEAAERGQMVFRRVLTQPTVEQLEKLAAEPEGARFFAVDRIGSANLDSARGMELAVVLTIDPAFLAVTPAALPE